MADLIEVTVGRIGRAHGLKGEVGIEVRTDEPGRRFVTGATLLLGQARRPVTLSSVRWHRGRLVVTLEGYPDRTAVEPLAGELLTARVPSGERPSEPEEYFDRQLVGLRVLDHAGRQAGVVAEVLHLPAQEVLRVVTADGERLVPFVTALVPLVDLDRGLMQLADVGGLLEDVE